MTNCVLNDMNSSSEYGQIQTPKTMLSYGTAGAGKSGPYYSFAFRIAEIRCTYMKSTKLKPRMNFDDGLICASPTFMALFLGFVLFRTFE